MGDFNLSGLKHWFTDNEDVVARIAQQRRDETSAEALPIMVGVFVVGLALGTMGAMAVAEGRAHASSGQGGSAARTLKRKAERALS